LNTWHLKQTVHSLARGGIVAYPTEAVYGLGCDPLNYAAVARLLAIKQRPWHKGLILIAADYSQLIPYLAPLSPFLQQRVFPTWPGPLTWLLPARPQTPAWLTGASRQLAVRVTAHPQAAALCRYWGGALISTSANLSQKPALKTAKQVRLKFGRLIEYTLPGAVGGQPRPTEIRDALTNTLLRT